MEWPGWLGLRHEKSPISCDIGLEAEVACCLRFAGRWKRPGSLRIQRCLSRRGRRYSGRFRSGLFRGFLGGRLFRYFFGSGFFGRRLFRGGLLGRYLFRGGFLCRRLFRCYLLDGGFLCWRLFGRHFLRRYFFNRSFLRRRFFRDYFFCWCFFSRRFFCRYFFSGCSFRGGFFSRRFFRSCHSYLLDHVAKSTSRLEHVKRFAALGQRITGPSAANTGAKPDAHSVAPSSVIAILEIMLFLLVLSQSASD